MSSDINVQTFSGKVNITSNLLVGSSHLFVDTINNRVGLVTNTPDAGLHVNSNAYVHTNFRVGSGIVMNDTTGRITAGSFVGDGSGITSVNSDSGSWVNGTDVVYLSTIGDKVGIGTVSPSSIFNTYGGGLWDGTDHTSKVCATLQVGRGSGAGASTQDAGTGAILEFRHHSDYRFVTLESVSEGNYSSEMGIRFKTMDATSGPEERMRIDAHGNVGIGTTTMTEKLTVNGNLDFTPAYGGDTTNCSGMIIFNKPIAESIDTSANIDSIYFNDSTNTYHFTQDTTKYATGNAGIQCGSVTATTFTGSLSTSVTPGSYLTGDAYNGSTARTFAVDATTAATASKIVARDSSGHIFANYLNMSHSASARNSDTVFYSSTDTYIRKNTAAGMRSSLGLTNSATITATTAKDGNKIVLRESDGNIRGNYFNTTPNDVTSGVTNVCVETGNDGWIRHGTAASIRTFIGATSADTASTVAMRDGSGDINVRLCRSDYQDQTDCGAGIAFRNSTSDNYIRFCTTMSSVRSRIGCYGSGSNITRTSHSNGFLVGSYNSVGDNAAKTNPIYTIGSSYQPSDTSLGDMYGIGYSHSNFTSMLVGGWGMYVAADGDARIGLCGSSGNIKCSRVLIQPSSSGGGQNLFTGYRTGDSYGRAQLVLSSGYSDIIIASSQANNNHGSNLTFAAYNPSNVGDYRKFVINQGNWGSRKHMLEFGYEDSSITNPHSAINSTDTVVTMNGLNKRVGIRNINPVCPLHVSGYQYIYLVAGRYFNKNTGNYITALGTNNYNTTLKVDGTVVSTDKFFQSSDRRIKKDIVDLNDSEALDTLRLIKPKKYKYKDDIYKGTEPVYGFIAQEVRDVLAYATHLINDQIPNIYELAEVSESNIITFTNFNTSELASNVSIIQIRSITNEEHDVNIVEVIDDHTIRVAENLDEWTGSVDENGNVITETTTYIGNKIFVFGQKVDDFVTLDKSSIFTIATAALQEVDRQLQAEKTKTYELRQKVEILEMSHGALIQRIEALENL
jgi:hypothetical protein